MAGMEFAAHGDLGSRIACPEHQLGPTVIQALLEQACMALEFIHAQGLLHGDLHPEHVLLAAPEEVRLTGFGAAVLPGEVPTYDETRREDAEYMTPEVVGNGRISPSSDIYSLGKTFLESLAGNRITMPTAVRHDEYLRVTLQDLARTHRDAAHLAGAIERMMAFRPEHRSRDCTEMLDALRSGPNSTDRQRGGRC